MAESYVKVTDPPTDDRESKSDKNSMPSTPSRLPSNESKSDLARLPTGGSEKGNERKSENKPGVDRQSSKMSTKKKKANDKDDLDAQTKLFSQAGIFSAAYAADSKMFFEIVEQQGVKVVETVGPVGDSPFLILYLCHSPAHLAIAEKLIKEYDEKLIFSEYKQYRMNGDQEVECPLYYGETILHLAVVNKNEGLVDFLLQTQQSIHAKGLCQELDLLNIPALGSFFSPPLTTGPCYYGQVPLGFAACTANVSLCTKLLDEWKANLQFEDSYGNNVLHLLAIHNLPEMFTYFLQKEAGTAAKSQPDYIPLARRKNKEGDTPLALAARNGNKEVFGMIIESSKVTVWTYGPIEMIKFPLGELDTLNLKKIDKIRKGEPVEEDEGETEGTIDTLIREGNLELLMQNVLIDILDNKWTRYAFRRYILRCFKQAVLILSVTLALILGFPDPCNYPFGDASKTTTSVFRIIFEAIVVFMIVTKGFSEAKELLAVGLKSYYGDVGVAFLENALSSAYCFFFGLVFILRIVGISRREYFIAHEGENSTTVFGENWHSQGIPGDIPDANEFNNLLGCVDILVNFIAVSLIYLYGVTLLLGFRLTGPFVIMIAKMMASDVTRWSVVFIVMWMGFATTFLALQSVPQQHTWRTGWHQLWINLVGLYYILMGNGDLEEFGKHMARGWSSFFYIGANLLLVTYSVLMAVMMLNLLIAMMMDTYAAVKETTQIQYMQYKAQIISSLENEMGAKDWQQIIPYWIMDNGEPWLQIQIKNEAFLQQSINLAAMTVAMEEIPPPAPEKSSEEVFDEADVNKDGNISKSELSAVEAKIRAQIEQELRHRYAHLLPRGPASRPDTGYVNVGDIEGEGFARPGVLRD